MSLKTVPADGFSFSDGENHRVRRVALDWVPLVLALVSLLVGLAGFFDRSATFHDEIINTHKANMGLVFDYALRPLYYFGNIVWYELFGYDPRSLVLGSVFAYVLWAMCHFKIGDLLGGRFLGSVAVLLFLGSSLVHGVGIRGMPHLEAGAVAFGALALFSLGIAANTSKSRYWYGFASGVVGVAALAIHPTVLAIVGGIGVVAGASIAFGMLSKLLKKQVLPNCLPSQQVSWAYSIGLLLALAVLSVLYHFFYGTNYISLFMGGVGNIQSTKIYTYYHKAWHFYFGRLWQINPAQVITLGCAVVGLPLAWLFSKRNAKRSPEFTVAFQIMFLVLTVSVVAFGLISCSKWKFDRVLVSFAPLLPLSAVALLGVVLRLSPTLSNGALGLFVRTAVILSCLYSLNAIVGETEFRRARRAGYHHKYSGMLNAIELIKDKRIGYIGPGAYTQYSTRRWVDIAEKEFVELGELGPLMEGERPLALVKDLLAEKKIAHLILNTKEGNAPGEQVERARKVLRRLGGHLVYDWRGLMEVWRVGPQLR